MALALGVLDQSPVPAGASRGDALRNTIDLAQLADELGYTRYWLAEHHGTPMLAGPSPEALIGPVAAATRRIRVGSGGVMLPYYSPLKVAETFGVLGGLFPDRIDLGVGRAPGTDPRTMLALMRDHRPFPDDFAEQLTELRRYLDGGSPELWLLGSSDDSVRWAAGGSLAYAFADFINPAGAPLGRAYRRSFRPSAAMPEPRLAVALAVLCAETAEEAQRLATSWHAAFRMMRLGRMIQVPPPEQALRILEALDLDPTRPPQGRRAIVGSRADVRAGIEAAVAEYEADEAILVTITYDHAARRRSYELVAEAFGLA